LLAGVSVLAGCAGSGDTLPAQECTVPDLSSEYVIGPGDTLEIDVWQNEGLSATLPVRPDGKISTPLVEDMQASGKTPTQLANDIEAVLSEYLRMPQVSVIVTQQGQANQIQVLGQVTNPQPQPYRQDVRVLDVIVAVGGLTEFAAGNRAEVIRKTPTGQVKCRVRLDDLLSGDTSQNIRLFAGDILLVPETRF
jgi:polysaccharide export outer membrane protein